MSNTPVARSEDTRTASSQRRIVGESFSFSGPIPPPTLLNQYDSATRKTIVTMAQRQSIHRQSIEKSVIASNIANEKIGMYLAAFLTFCMIVAGVILIICDKPVIGFISIFAPAFFHASNYIYNKRQENQIRDEEQIKPKPKE